MNKYNIYDTFTFYIEVTIQTLRESETPAIFIGIVPSTGQRLLFENINLEKKMWLFIPVSNKNIQDILKGQISPNSLFITAELHSVVCVQELYFDLNNNHREFVVRYIFANFSNLDNLLKEFGYRRDNRCNTKNSPYIPYYNYLSALDSNSWYYWYYKNQCRIKHLGEGERCTVYKSRDNRYPIK